MLSRLSPAVATESHRMHVTLLSRGEAIHSTHRLVEAARTLGHRVRVLDPLSLQMGLGKGVPLLLAGEKPPPRTDVVIPRFGQSIHTYGLALVNQYDLAGVPALNDATSIAQARNKMRLMQLLLRSGLPVPPTVMGRGADELGRMVEHVGGLPVALKILEGPERSGVLICESAQSMEATLDAVLAMGHNIVVQRYVEPGEGRDLRALVVGGKLVAAVRRHPAPGRLRHTLGAGKRVTPVRLAKAQAHLAIEATRVVGLEVAAVDLVELDGSTRVFDVHPSPGLRDLEAAAGEDLAVPIIQRAVEIARQRRARPLPPSAARSRRPPAT